MKKRLALFALGVSALASLLASRPANAQTAGDNLYDATTNPANPQTGVVNYMQMITLTGPSSNVTVQLSQLVLGINFTTGAESGNYGVLVDFWSGVDTSPTSTDALASATDLFEISGTLSDPGQSGNFTYTFTLDPSTFHFLSPTSTLGVQVRLTDSAFSTFSDDMNGRFTANGPTAGSAPGYVWNDANGNGTFTGAEQTKFGQPNAYIKLGLGGTTTGVPEPSTWAMFGVGLAMLIVLRRRFA